MSRCGMGVRGVEKKVSGKWQVVEGTSADGTRSEGDAEEGEGTGPSGQWTLPRVPGETAVGGLLKLLGGLEIVAALIAGAVVASDLPGFAIVIVVAGGLRRIATGGSRRGGKLSPQNLVDSRKVAAELHEGGRDMTEGRQGEGGQREGECIARVSQTQKDVREQVVIG